jgi:hypothetical protein
MMVMSFVRALVSSWLSRYFDGFDPTVGQQHRDRPVDGRHPQTLDSPRRHLEQFVDAKRPFRVGQDRTHGVPLLRLPAHTNHYLLPSAPELFTAAAFFPHRALRLPHSLDYLIMIR